MLLQGTYDYRLVALSFLLSLLGAYGTLELAARVTATRSWWRITWISCGATVMGAGICATHFAGMLSFRLPAPVFYRYPVVILAFLVAIFASFVALFSVSRPTLTIGSCLISSILMGTGIAAMHYIAIEAMDLPAVIVYRWKLVALSVILDIAISFGALTLALCERKGRNSFSRKILAAVVLGGGIPLMHYTGIEAVCFRASSAALTNRQSIRISTAEIIITSLTILLVMLAVTISALLDRTRIKSDLDDLALRGEAQFHSLAEAIPQIVWIADANGQTTYINSLWYEMTGMSPKDGFGMSWEKMVHPDDRGPCREKWESCVHAGKTFEIEYRLHDAVKGYRWYLDRAIPLRDDSGVIQQWFGTCTDIEEQKLYQQTLEKQIKERTEELADANARLQHEMWEKDAARRTLDEQNEKMMRSLKDRSQRATLLAKMGELLQSCRTREEIFTAALGFAPKVFPRRRGAIALFNSSRSLVEITGQWRDCQLPLKSFEADACWALRIWFLLAMVQRVVPTPMASQIPISVCRSLRRAKLSASSTSRLPKKIHPSARPSCPSKPRSPRKWVFPSLISACAMLCAHSLQRIP